MFLPIYITRVLLDNNQWFSQLNGGNSPNQPLVTMNEAKLDTVYSRIADLLRVVLTEKLQTPTQVDQLLLEEASLMEDSAKAQEAHAAESARYNIAVVGRTGVGKSELINYLFNKQVAKSGIGKPVTKRGFTRQDFDVQGIPGTLFDSWGLEVDKSTEWISDLKEEMRRRGTDKPVEDWFHTIFLCIDACSSRNRASKFLL